MNDYDTQVNLSVNGSSATTPEVPAAEKPEVLLGAAFAGGFLLAKILRRIAS